MTVAPQLDWPDLVHYQHAPGSRPAEGAGGVLEPLPEEAVRGAVLALSPVDQLRQRGLVAGREVANQEGDLPPV